MPDCSLKNHNMKKKNESKKVENPKESLGHNFFKA